jgi:hypothetical protein
MSNILPFKNMVDRHPGLIDCVEALYKYSASVVLDKHHNSPQEFSLKDDNNDYNVRLEWEKPDERTKSALANLTDSKEAGAYGIALAAVEYSRGYVAVRRAEELTGSDYYVAPAGSKLDDLEEAYRLEVSGSELNESKVKRVLSNKLEQAKNGKSDLPAIAAVVGFAVKLILVQTLEK